MLGIEEKQQAGRIFGSYCGPFFFFLGSICETRARSDRRCACIGGEVLGLFCFDVVFFFTVVCARPRPYIISGVVVDVLCLESGMLFV